MHEKALPRLFEVAADQYGHFTVAQAREVGVSPKTLHKMKEREELQHVSYGVYRLTLFPPSIYDQYMAAVLWPKGANALISHESALNLHGLSDVSPSRIHLTVPAGHRVRRPVPRLYVLHRGDVENGRDLVEGIPVTDPVRTIFECHESHLGPALVRQSIEDGQRFGKLTSRQARQLVEKCADWMYLHRPDLRGRGAETIERARLLIRGGMEGQTVEHVAEQIHVGVRGLEDDFRRRALPPPGTYVRFGRLMPGVCMISRKPSGRLLDAAMEGGYSTASAYNRSLGDALEVGAKELRRRLSFEWVAYRMGLHRSASRSLESPVVLGAATGWRTKAYVHGNG